MTIIQRIIDVICTNRESLRLTESQIEVLDMLNKGMTLKQCGEALGISASQARNRVKLIPAMVSNYIFKTEKGLNKVEDRHPIIYANLDRKVKSCFLSLHFQPEYWEDVALMYPYIKLQRNVGEVTMNKIWESINDHVSDSFIPDVRLFQLKRA